MADIGSNIQVAANFLNNGNLVAIPTETVYGLAANAFNKEAVSQIYAVKNRPQINPLILHANSFERLEDWGIYLPKNAIKLAEKFSPGPITFVVPKSAKIPYMVTAGHESVAIRIPKHPLTLELLKIIDFPVAAPSANPSGYISPTSAQHVNEQIGSKINYILDGGNCQVGLESTILSFVEPKVKLLRLGGLAIEEIEAVIGEKLDINTLQNNENPLAPGMLSRHYAPKTKLIIGNPLEFIHTANVNNIGVISFNQTYKQMPIVNQICLASDNNLQTAAANLYAAMRYLDNLNLEFIIAEKFPEIGLGLAINDRLKRASIS